jgi:hypothetical protein
MPQRAWSAKRERQYEHIKQSHSGPRGRTYEQLRNEARLRGIRGRSKMTKAELERALPR